MKLTDIAEHIGEGLAFIVGALFLGNFYFMALDLINVFK